MQLKIHHATRYSFAEPVQVALQQVRKTPKSAHHQSVVDWHTEIVGGQKELVFEDQHNNVTELISAARDTRELQVISEGTVHIEDTQGVAGPHRGPAPLWLYLKATPRTEAKAGVRGIVRNVETSAPLEALHELSGLVRDAIRYEVGASQSDWSAEEAIEAGSGVCQDHAHVFIACARRMEIPARYVSGYLMLNDRTTQDAMHAWAEAHVEGLGWVGFDVSNGISPDTRYVRVATGLDYADAAPVSGTRVGGADEVLEVQISVAQQ